MLKRYQCTFGHALLLLDAAAMVLAWCAAYWLRFFLPLRVPAFLEVTKGFPRFSSYAALFPLVAGVWMSVLLWMRAYDARSLIGRGIQVVSVLRAHAVALLLFITATYFLGEGHYSRLVIVYFGVLGAGAMVATRLAARSVIGALCARGYYLRNVLAVGEGLTLATLIERVERLPELGLRVIGVVTAPESAWSTLAGRPVLGDYAGLSSVLRAHKVDEVLIALPPAQSRVLDTVLEQLTDETLDVRIVPDVAQHVTLGCEVEEFAGLPIVRLNDSPVIGWGALAKRMTDILASAVALVLLSPLLLLIAAIVKLTSPGPILYVQERMGLDGRSFRMLKFRSMRVDAEQQSGAVWAQAGDARRTRFGTFLRQTSLDELPQLWNVLCGDMSLVGPRPERPVFVNKFRTEIPHYMLRHKVRAGITGWAQVNGWRGNTSLNRRIECDLFYIRNWSYALDLKILTMTLWKGFIDKNAY
jgi:Undecaprenyl-phosphate glucose phosphotransferase